mgnify:CR=1 FL=1
MESKGKQMTENEQELIPYSKLEREEDILELLCQWENQKIPLDVMKISEYFGMEKKESLILISHQERIIRMADRIMVISDGKIDRIGPAEEILPTLLDTSSQEACCYGQQKGGDYCEA